MRQPAPWVCRLWQGYQYVGDCARVAGARRDMTTRDLYRLLRKRLSAVTTEADSEARLILGHVLGTSWSGCLLRFDDRFPDADKAVAIAGERLTGRPLAYVLGTQCFYGADFEVDERVLIPRFDSESVAEAAILEARAREARTVADICCGSGCLGITISREAPVERLALSDISPEALDVARANAKRLAPGADISFACADLLAGLGGKVDLIVCNPPYVSEDEYETLDELVRCHEPRLALVAPENGLLLHRRLAAEAPAFLRKGGALVAEFGDTQEEVVRRIFENAGWSRVRTGRDYSGKPRFAVAAPD